jgi:hypothetical protein
MTTDASVLATRLFEYAQVDTFPDPDVVLAFGIDSNAHFTVLVRAIRAGELTPELAADVAYRPSDLNAILLTFRSLGDFRPLPVFSD